jgi:hypothetical protein
LLARGSKKLRALAGGLGFLAASTLCAADPSHPQYQRILPEEGFTCAWGMGLMGKRFSANPQLIAVSPRSSSIVNVSEEGRVERIQIPPTHTMAPSFRKSDNKQKTFWPQHGDHHLQLDAGEKVTAVAFGVQTKELDDSRIVIGTSHGRIAVLSGNLMADDPVVTPLMRANDGKGPITKLVMAEDQFRFQVLAGDRASAHFIDDGKRLWNFNATAVDRDRTHDLGVTDATFGAENTYVTVGGDNLGRIYVSRPGRQDPSMPLRLLSPNGDATPQRNQLQHVAVTRTADIHWFVTADEHGKVLAYQRHLGPASDRKLPVEIYKGGLPIRQMAFAPSEINPKLVVVAADGSPRIFRFDTGSATIKKVPFPIFERVTTATWISRDEILPGTESGEVQKWNVTRPSTPILLTRFVGHLGPIQNLRVIQGRRAVISIDAEGDIRAAPVDGTMRTQYGEVRDIP